ncbi:uncharacterized protein LOC18437588 [Amborella trichopoda]|uniref:HD/PDEase domain-containing protein n=1 Tax=Amborella trichopoda TaxID=13333 RepID=W1PQD9_AMBTC|nr:uncharacterized protein LOC18437588 [Amborella trichopoda]ERN09435.1 hypothetical protein AMTR_s00029p00069980 [Amborella trichopoda]|eukprot:XP_006847854.1 uncharacterized protein LOC18437588 [Amborella trichopoda]
MGEVVRRAEELVQRIMRGWDASHDAFHAFRVRNLALSLALQENLTSPDTLEIIELAALLHDIGDYKYVRDASDEKMVERFLEENGVDDWKREKIVGIIDAMGFKNEISGVSCNKSLPEFGVVQDADRLDAIGAIGIARCFTFGGNRNNVLHDPEIKPRLELSKQEYMKKDEKQTTLNHFHEKLLKLKDLMKTEAGRRMAEKRHKFMQDFLSEFYEEWDGKA